MPAKAFTEDVFTIRAPSFRCFSAAWVVKK